jgi:PBP1b-binding outer membrane lipoprotein LpoB
MKKYHLLLVAVSALFFAGCESMGTSSDPDLAGIEVTSQTDKKANLSGYKTYSWIAVAAVLNDPDGKWQPPGFKAGDEIKNLVDGQMKNKGYTLKGASADLGVAYMLGIDMEARKFKMNPETKVKEMQDVAKGALVVVLVDMRTGFIVWMGEASRAAKKTAEGENVVDDTKTRKILNYAVSRMFDKM